MTLKERWQQLLATVRGRRGGRIQRYTLNRRRYRLFIPPGYRPTRPCALLVMLHGCTQDPDDFAAGTVMDQVAAGHTCLVLYPEQPARANRQRCWNWFRSSNQVRGLGEPAELVALVEHVAQSYNVERTRVFVAGLSAGACMAVILGVLYPDVFAAVGVCAGMPYAAARTVVGALIAMRAGASPRSGAVPGISGVGAARQPGPLVIFHGTADDVVALENSTQLVRQWATLHQLAATGVSTVGAALIPTQTWRHTPSGKRPYNEEVYHNRQGAEVIRRYLVEGMGHAWPGGIDAGTYTDAAGPPASDLMLKFFLRVAAANGR